MQSAELGRRRLSLPAGLHSLGFYRLLAPVAPKKSASDLRTDFLSQKTLEHFCLQFRKRLPSIPELELLKHPSRRKNKRKLSGRLLSVSRDGILCGKYQMAILGSTSEPRGVWRVVFCVFLTSASCTTGTSTREPAPPPTPPTHEAGCGEAFKVKVLLET